MALMALVAGIARATLVSVPVWLAPQSLVLIAWYRVNSTWVIAGGAVAGVVFRLVH